MNNLEILANALEYIESNLQNEMKTEEVAKACFCSKSSLEKIFRHISGMGVHDYVIRRRMMIAAKLIADNKELSLLDVALVCGYSTNESLTRAFKSVWNINPSEFRCMEKFSELFPRLYAPIQDGGSYLMMRKNVDISEMYEVFVQRKDCYFVCSDIKKLVPINEISHKAGDLAILESMKRLQGAAGENDIVFRIGGDEFVVLTDSEDEKYAESLCDKIKARNGETFRFEEKEIPLELHVGVVKFEGKNLKYKDLFEQLHNEILNYKS